VFVCGLCFMFVCLFVCLSFSPFINEMIRNSPACLRKKRNFVFLGITNCTKMICVKPVMWLGLQI
jgi:hypothetical protein